MSKNLIHREHLYSADGATWQTPTEIFPGKPEAFRGGSVAYDPSTQNVWAITGSRIYSGYIYFRTATLDQGGTPIWGTIRQSADLNQGGYRNTSNRNENNLACSYNTISKLDGGDYLAVSSATGEGDDDDDRVPGAGWASGDLGTFSNNAGRQIGGEVDDTGYYDEPVAVPGGNSTQFFVFSNPSFKS